MSGALFLSILGSGFAVAFLHGLQPATSEEREAA